LEARLPGVGDAKVCCTCKQVKPLTEFNKLKRPRTAVDCGEEDIVVLEFDHLRDKQRNVSTLIGGGWEWTRILEEIERCEVVCANCHRRRTARRANSYRHRASTEASGGGPPGTRTQNHNRLKGGCSAR
jgi:5-methylcytosine-specific restriction endonuclease McrA